MRAESRTLSIALAAASICYCSANAGDEPFPKDFKVEARFSAPFVSSWTGTIAPDGKTTQESKPAFVFTKNGKGGKKGSPPSEAKADEKTPTNAVPEKEGKKNSAITEAELKELLARHLSVDDMKNLAEKVKNADFFSLKKSYEPTDVTVYDAAHFSLTITSNNKTHTVSIYAANMMPENTEVQRFLSVWNLVNDKFSGAIPGPAAQVVIPKDKKK